MRRPAFAQIFNQTSGALVQETILPVKKKRHVFFGRGHVRSAENRVLF